MTARFFIAIGAPLVAFVRYLGELVLLAGATFRSVFTHRLRWRLFLQQIVVIGLLSQVALMVSGRVGAAMSAEIGTMKVTEQIDALRALAVYPVDYLVVPRALAMMISMPLLTAECIGFGIVASYLVAIVFLDINGTYYVANMVQWTRMRDLIMGVSKAFVFGLLIVFICCHKGLTTKEGAVGVGRATTEAVVISSLAVLVSNFFLTMALNIVYPAGYQ